MNYPSLQNKKCILNVFVSRIGFHDFLRTNEKLKNIWNLRIVYNIWRPPSQRELTSMIFNTGLTHLGLEASI